MEVPFTSEQLAELTRIARDEGTTPAQLVQEAGLRLIEDDARFREAMRQGMNDSGGLFAARPEADAAWLPELPDQPIMEARKSSARCADTGSKAMDGTESTRIGEPGTKPQCPMSGPGH